jgi:hypothetical protein
MSPTPLTPPGAMEQGGELAAWRVTGTQACWLCGIRLPARSMVPDGGPACADVHWYCADTPSCTQRWTQAGRVPGAANGPPADAQGPPPLPSSRAASRAAAPRPRRQRA